MHEHSLEVPTDANRAVQAGRSNTAAKQETSARHDDHSHGRDDRRGFLTSRTGLVFLGFGIIAGALLFSEHRAHVLGALIYLPLLLCPLMHLWHRHGGHGHRGGDRSK